VTQPIDGIREDGFEGLFKGVGKGVVGFVAQPATGIIDLASGSLNALKRAVDVNQEAHKMRPSRHFSLDTVLHAYNRQKATGYTILKELEQGKFSSDDYVSHLVLGHHLVMITSMRVMMVKKGMISNHWECDWMEEWSNLENVIVVSERNHEVKLILKVSQILVYIPFSIFH